MSRNGDDNQVNRILGEVNTLTPEQQEQVLRGLVGAWVSGTDVDSERLATNSTRSIRLQNQQKQLQNDIIKSGEDAQKELRSIAEDLDRHCKFTSIAQGIGEGTTLLGSAMVIVGLGTSLFGYDEIGGKIIDTGSKVNIAGNCVSVAAEVCKIGITLWDQYNIQERIITPYEDKCNRLIETNTELHAVIEALKSDIVKCPSLSFVHLGIPICTLSFKAYKFGARQYISHRSSKSLSTKSHIDADTIIKPSSCIRDSATDHEAYLTNTSFGERDLIPTFFGPIGNRVDKRDSATDHGAYLTKTPLGIHDLFGNRVDKRDSATDHGAYLTKTPLGIHDLFGNRVDKRDSATDHGAYLTKTPLGIHDLLGNRVDKRDSATDHGAYLTKNPLGRHDSAIKNTASLSKTSHATENKTRSFSTYERVQLSASSAVSFSCSCYNLYNLRENFKTGQFSEAAVELRKLADSIEQRTVSFT